MNYSEAPTLKKGFNLLLVNLYRHLGAVALVFLTTLLLRGIVPALEVQIIALIYLLPAMLSVVFWGLTPGIVASILAFLGFNYFFIQPINTLLVHQTKDLIFLLIFLIVAGVMSQLIGQARVGTKIARARELEATRMYELISTLAGKNNNYDIAETLVNKLMETFSFAQVQMNDQTGVSLAASSEVPIHETPSLIIPMETGRNSEGVVNIWYGDQFLSPEDKRLLLAFVYQGALAIERAHLFKTENIAKVLEESDRIKTSLLNSVSHELRTPLAVIKASVSSLRSGVVDWKDVERAELLATIEEETDHLNLLVGNLLDMSRIESGSLSPKMQMNSIAEIALGVAAKMHGQLQNHIVKFDFPSDLPLVPADYVLIGQVFTNLLSNSAKYAPAATTIHISAIALSDELIVKVGNQSPPIPESDLLRIFEKFHRITKADKITGTGLGLSICKGIIEAHGGSIRAENNSEGFWFVFTLPLKSQFEMMGPPGEVIDG